MGMNLDWAEQKNKSDTDYMTVDMRKEGVTVIPFFNIRSDQRSAYFVAENTYDSSCLEDTECVVRAITKR